MRKQQQQHQQQPPSRSPTHPSILICLIYLSTAVITRQGPAHDKRLKALKAGTDRISGGEMLSRLSALVARSG
ncbi:GL21776 [Drosophila persimilis]|uniref:GL21776 n=1 Tax=Drosophila persimilis TaxID=7234 RepID=B4GEM4_DROPE|nr:GL21776 [Drosophila persimilis]